jgi:hypothetical protein
MGSGYVATYSRRKFKCVDSDFKTSQNHCKKFDWALGWEGVRGLRPVFNFIPRYIGVNFVT